MSTKVIEIERRVTASANQYIQYEVDDADWNKYLEMCEGNETEAVYALRDADLLTYLEWADELDEVFEVHHEKLTLSDGEGDSHD